MNPADTPEVYQVRTIASGSSGNCIFVRIGEVRLLLDVGISRRRITQALAEIGEDLGDINAMLVTHEHDDHIAALRTIRERYPHMPIYSTAGTALGCLKRKRWRYSHDVMQADVPFHIGPVQITPFATSHDVIEPVGLRIETDRFALGLATDLGRWSASVERALEDCQVLIIEANYDVEMLWHGPYPLHLKRRVVSHRGHLSNDQARELVSRVAGPRLEQIIFGHLSAQNNTPEKVLGALGNCLSNAPRAEILVASRTEPGPLLSFTGSEPTTRRRAMPSPEDWQQSLFPMLSV